jgi:hypothetical protein
MRRTNWFYTIPLRLRSLFHRRQVERELDEELRYHLDRQIEEHIAKGMTEEEARYTTLRAMSGVEQRKEECRDMRRVRWIEDLMQDVRYSLRTLRKNPGFTAVATLTLALGIGANTAIFTVIDALMLKRLPVRKPEQLVRFETHFVNIYPNGATEPRTGYDFPHSTFVKFRTLANFFSDVSGIGQMDRANVMVDGPDGSMDSSQVVVGMASGNYFSNLGVQAAPRQNLHTGR